MCNGYSTLRLFSGFWITLILRAYSLLAVQDQFPTCFSVHLKYSVQLQCVTPLWMNAQGGFKYLLFVLLLHLYDTLFWIHSCMCDIALNVKCSSLSPTKFGSEVTVQGTKSESFFTGNKHERKPHASVKHVFFFLAYFWNCTRFAVTLLGVDFFQGIVKLKTYLGTCIKVHMKTT